MNARRVHELMKNMFSVVGAAQQKWTNIADEHAIFFKTEHTPSLQSHS